MNIFYKYGNGKFVIVLLLAGSLLVTTQVILSNSVGSVRASEPQSIKSLLQRMDSKVRSEKGFIVIIDFINPLLADEKSWSIGDESGKVDRSINEIGDDYVCFKERVVQGPDFIRCTPFSNIVSIDYLPD